MKVSQYALDREEEDRRFEGPDQEPDSAVIVACYIAAFGRAVSIALVIAILAVCARAAEVWH